MSARDASLKAPVEHDAIGAVLAALFRHLGTDFSEYRRPMVERRIASRMRKLGTSTIGDYLRRLEADGNEARALLERVTIKGSRFYRNAATFELLRRVVLPELASQSPGRPLQLWSAGCGRGEEAWSLAMLLDEAGLAGDILATDLDEGALATAVLGIYPESAAQELPLALREPYLEPVAGSPPGRLRVRGSLRPRVRFARHDLLQDGPPALPGGGDLICCRNVLIYLRRSAQERAIACLRAALRPGGWLCLGEAEWPPRVDAAPLEAVDARARLFRQPRGAGPETTK
jgi:chemotaxis methyl-accepting protein methylase